MFGKTMSAAVCGIDGYLVQVEADISDGLPQFEMVGFLASEVKEAKERVRVSLKNSGFSFPLKRLIINLSPADRKKEGNAFDLPIAISILTALGVLSEDYLKQTIIVGELSLNGSVNAIQGVLPMILAARESGFKRCIVPASNAEEGAFVSDIDIIGVSNLTEMIQFILNKLELLPVHVNFKSAEQKRECLDFSDVMGQEGVKRAAEIAVAGKHNLLMIGPPGAGKTMIAKRIPGIMPRLSVEESMEISKIYSVCGLLGQPQSIIVQRPFRSPHHTITKAAFAGGGRNARPGEVSLADKGILFLDELTEFNRETIEVLRQPLEEKTITVSREKYTNQYPADFMLLAAMNPCKCGYYPDRSRCRCSNSEIQRYLGKISRPLLDRFDLSVETTAIQYNDLTSTKKEETSGHIKNRILRARKMQQNRYDKETFHFNSELPPKALKKFCKLDAKEESMLKQAYEVFHLSARAYHRILRVARTIADLSESEEISDENIKEAIYYRSFEQKYWGEF